MKQVWTVIEARGTEDLEQVLNALERTLYSIHTITESEDSTGPVWVVIAHRD